MPGEFGGLSADKLLTQDRHQEKGPIRPQEIKFDSETHLFPVFFLAVSHQESVGHEPDRLAGATNLQHSAVSLERRPWQEW